MIEAMALSTLLLALLSAERRTTSPFWQRTRDGRLVGFRVMHYDTIRGVAVSTYDSEISVPLERGAVHRMAGRGMYLANTPEFVVDHYAISGHDVLMVYAFDERDMISGQLTDRESEITVRRAELLDFFIGEAEDDGEDEEIRKALEAVTEEILDRMQESGWFFGESRDRRFDRPTAWHINCGWCDDWADLAASRVGGYPHGLDGDIHLQRVIAEAHGLVPVPTPRDADQDRYDELVSLMPAHTVLYLDGRYYDSQAPGGVVDPADLPLVQGISLEEWLGKR